MSLPAYFLAARAIELALKSYMLLQGQTEKDLRSVSHNLAAALDTAVSLGLPWLLTVPAESEQAIRWINDYYASKDLEYPTTGYKSYPEIRYLLEFAESLLARLRSWRPEPQPR
jgi:HEPN domain-containing protein